MHKYGKTLFKINWFLLVGKRFINDKNNATETFFNNEFNYLHVNKITF